MSFDEAAWWGDCANTFHEEQKQLAYALRMGLIADWGCGHPPTFDLAGRSVIDIGGGPVSLLLKCCNRGESLVVDPGEYPVWVAARYRECGIGYKRGRGEDIPISLRFDEAWLYNVLQHVDDPEQVITSARQVADTIRIFEWVNIDPYPGHPHQLVPTDLDQWLGGQGFVCHVDDRGAVGQAFYGVFTQGVAAI
jgi:hypothetical protein